MNLPFIIQVDNVPQHLQMEISRAKFESLVEHLVERSRRPCEQALEGTRVRDEENPFELVRIVRSFDPCLACSIHMVTPRGDEIGRLHVA